MNAPDRLPANGRLDPPRRPLRVLQVVGNAIVGGMESWVLRLVERLPRERFEFWALCPFESGFTDRLRALGATVHVAPLPDDPPWTTVQMTASIVQHAGIDLLHAHLPKAHLLAGMAGALTGRPVVATVHGRFLSTLDLEVHHFTRSHLSVVCPASHFHALALGVDPSCLSCEPNGVDTKRFRPLPEGSERPPALRASLGLAPEVPLVGFVGRLSAEKGPEVFVRSAMILASHRPDVHAVLVGEGPLREEVTGLIRRFGLQDRVHLAGARTDMQSVYQALDLAVSCSHSEAMPLAVMEAMASGVPVVATRVGGVSDLIEHGQTGWLVAPGDFDDIGNQCAELLARPERLAAMGRAARERAVARLGLDASVARVAQLLESVAARGRPLALQRAPDVPADRRPALSSETRNSPRSGLSDERPEPTVAQVVTAVRASSNGRSHALSKDAVAPRGTG